jgi:hypothetical protein
MGTQYRQLTVEERVEIYRLLADGKSRRAMGALLGRSAATGFHTRDLKTFVGIETVTGVDPNPGLTSDITTQLEAKKCAGTN